MQKFTASFLGRDCPGAFGLRDAVHLHETEAFGALGVLVGNDLDIGHGADTGEQLEEVALSGIIGEVTDVEARRGNFDSLGLAGRTRFARRALLAGFLPSWTLVAAFSGGFRLRR